jgi:hypothetical protein
MAAAPWALGGGLVSASVGGLYKWHESRSMVFGPVHPTIGPAPEVPGMPRAGSSGFTWSAVAQLGIIGAIVSAVVAISAEGYDEAFGFLGMSIALFALLRALKAVIHHPLAMIPVGEPPPEPDANHERLARPGTWAAVAAAAVGLAFAAVQIWG